MQATTAIARSDSVLEIFKSLMVEFSKRDRGVPYYGAWRQEQGSTAFLFCCSSGTLATLSRACAIKSTTVGIKPRGVKKYYGVVFFSILKKHCP